MLSSAFLNSEKKRRRKVSLSRLLEKRGSKDLKGVTSFQAVVDTSEMTLSYLGDFLPKLRVLNLDNSSLSSVRDVGGSLKKLKILSMKNCGLSTIDGIAAVSMKLHELYLSGNKISDISDLIGLDKLRILDLESNRIERTEDVALLGLIPALRELVLRGNEAASAEKYRQEVKAIIPSLEILDGEKFEEQVVVPFEPKAPLPELKDTIINRNGVSESQVRQRRIKNNRMLSKTKILQPKAPRIWHNVGPIKL